MIGIGLSNSAPSSSDCWTITPDELRIPLRKCCLCAQFKCYPSPRSHKVFSLSLWERVGVRANARIQREAWAPTNSNRYTTNYLHRENVALGLVPSQAPAGPLPWCPLTL